MEFDSCVTGGNSRPIFEEMKRMYASHGYTLPNIIFWNVNSHSNNIPVKFSKTGAALVSGASPSLFDMVTSEEMNPAKIMLDILGSERYKEIKV